MKYPLFPQNELIEALVNRNIECLFGKYGYELPPSWKIKEYITIDRQQIAAYLKTKPELAIDYFKRHSVATPHHDTQIIWKQGDYYYTAWMDHGTRTSVTEHKTIEAAVADDIATVFNI